MENRYGKISELNFELCKKDGKTILSNSYFTSPFKIMKPFYENGIMRIIQMSASPGIMDGDYQKICIKVKNGSKAQIYSQSFEKIHKMLGSAKREIVINSEKNTFFIYSPLPAVPYENSSFENVSKISLDDETSQFIYEEILTCGRVLRGEKFKYRKYISLIEIYENDNLTYRDNTIYIPEEMNMSGIGIYENFTHLLNMVICNIDMYDIISEILEEYQYPCGVSKTYYGYFCVKALGTNAQQLMEVAEKIKFKSLDFIRALNK